MSGVYELERLVVRLSADTAPYLIAMQRVEHSMHRGYRRMQYLGGLLSIALAVPFVAAIRTYAEFEDALVKSLANFENVTDDMAKAMEDQALQISTQSVTAATELAAAYGILASAGFEVTDSLRAMGDIERFAVAGAFSMEEATELLAGAHFALGNHLHGTEESYKRLVRLTDVLTKANLLAAGTQEDFARALTAKGGARLRLLNKDMEEGVAILAIYAKQNLLASKAGERMEILLRELQRAADKFPAAWDRVNVSIFDSAGAMRHIADIVGDLEQATKGMTVEELFPFFEELGFRARSFPAIASLLGFSEELRQVDAQLRGATGDTMDIAEKKLASFSAQMLIMWNRTKLVGKEIGEVLAPQIKKLSDQLQAGITYWMTLNDAMKTLAVYSSLAMIAAIPLKFALELLAGVIIYAGESFLWAMALPFKFFKMILNGVRFVMSPLAKLRSGINITMAYVSLLSSQGSKHIGKFYNKIKNTAFVKSVVAGIKAPFQSLFKTIKNYTALLSMKGGPQAFGALLLTKINQVKGWWNNMVINMRGRWYYLLAAISKLTSGAGGGLSFMKGILTSALNTMRTIMPSLTSEMIHWLSTPGRYMRAAFPKTYRAALHRVAGFVHDMVRRSTNYWRVLQFYMENVAIATWRIWALVSGRLLNLWQRTHARMMNALVPFLQKAYDVWNAIAQVAARAKTRVVLEWKGFLALTQAIWARVPDSVKKSMTRVVKVVNEDLRKLVGYAVSVGTMMGRGLGLAGRIAGTMIRTGIHIALRAVPILARAAAISVRGIGAALNKSLGIIGQLGALLSMLGSAGGKVAGFANNLFAFSLIIPLVVSVTGLLLSWPAILAGIVVAWVKFSTQGQKALTAIKDFIGPTYEQFMRMFNGIRDAIYADDLGLAFEVLMGGMKSVAITFLNSLTTLFGDTFGTVFAQLISGDFSGAWTTVLAGLSAMWTTWSQGVMETIQATANFLIDAWKNAMDGLSQWMLKKASDGSMGGKILDKIFGLGGADMAEREKKTRRQQEERRRRQLAEGMNINDPNLQQIDGVGTSLAQAQKDVEKITGKTANSLKAAFDEATKIATDEAAKQDKALRTATAGGAVAMQEQADQAARDLMELENRAIMGRALAEKEAKEAEDALGNASDAAEGITDQIDDLGPDRPIVIEFVAEGLTAIATDSVEWLTKMENQTARMQDEVAKAVGPVFDPETTRKMEAKMRGARAARLARRGAEGILRRNAPAPTVEQALSPLGPLPSVNDVDFNPTAPRASEIESPKTLEELLMEIAANTAATAKNKVVVAPANINQIA